MTEDFYVFSCLSQKKVVPLHRIFKQVNDMQPIKRTLQDLITERMLPQKVMLLFGARRVGKTILMRQIVDSFTGKTLVLNGEDIDTQTLLEKTSVSNYRHLFEGVELLAIDEAQHIPQIGSKLKLIVDELPGIRVIATGSSSFNLQSEAGEPLVGRSSQFLLTPFSQQELSAGETPIETYRKLEERLIYGSYPDVTLFDTYAQKREYLQDIVDAYLLKDILAVDGIKNSQKMYDLLRLIAYQTGSEVSYEELGKQLSMSRNTVERYLDLLQKVFVIYRLGGFSRNLRKEVAKASKWYFYDNGIRNAIIRNFQPLDVRSETDRGALWENYIISERRKLSLNQRLDTQFYFWRTYDNQEIDLIEEKDGVLTAYEMKAGKKQARVPIGFKNAYPDTEFYCVNRDNYLDFI